MSHQAHGDDPNPYPGGELTPGTIVLLILLSLGMLALVLVYVP